MKARPIHENLDTSFVNLSALLRYLQRRQFVGRVRVELSGYEADIILRESDQLQVREHDRIAGRVAEGEEALQRLLIRAREPGGTIHVYQSVSEAEKKDAAPGKTASFSLETKLKLSGAPKTVSNASDHQRKFDEEKFSPPKSSVSLPDFPFELTNEVEAKARKTQQLAPEEWKLMLRLIGELFDTVDKTLRAASLNFSAALTKVRAEIAADYPFINPASGAFDYADGKVFMNQQVSAKLFAASINEALRRILEKLSSSPKFSRVYRDAVQKIIALIHCRKPLYQKFCITPQLEKIIGA